MVSGGRGDGGHGDVAPRGGRGGRRPCGHAHVACLESLSQAEGGLEKEGQVPGVTAGLPNMPSAERGW